jgi:hypothetical protein
MDGYLKESTSSARRIGPFLSSTDGFSALTGLTIANTDIRISKGGGAFIPKNSGGGTHDENGYYAITLDTTDLDTLGNLKVASKMAGALPVWHDFIVLPANVYDSLVAGSDLLGIDASDVWAYATRTLTQAVDIIAASVSGSIITVYRGTRWYISITSLPDLTNYDEIYFSVKKHDHDPDNSALVRISLGSGLERLGGADASLDSGDGSITVVDASAGSLTIVLEANQSALLSPNKNLLYDIKGVDTGTDVVLLAKGKLVISADITRAVT